MRCFGRDRCRHHVPPEEYRIDRGEKYLLSTERAFDVLQDIQQDMRIFGLAEF